MFLALLLVALESETGARWSVRPSTVEVGEPFELVLELEHEREERSSALAPGEPVLDVSWLVLERRPARSEAAGTRVRTTHVWSLASLEPGERNLAEALAGYAFGEGVTRIQAGDARLRVTSVLAEGEDTARPMMGFEGELEGPPATRSRVLVWLALGAACAALLAWWLLRRRGKASAPAAPPTSSERLATLAARAAQGAAREGCYDLTHLLREHVDRLRGAERAALTDEEWLAEVARAPDVPRAALEDLRRVFARAERVKYGGEAPSPWAVEELFTESRRALEGLTTLARSTEARP